MAYGQDVNKIQQRIWAREAAEAAISLAAEFLTSQIDTNHFWKCVREMADGKTTQPKQALKSKGPMTDVEATRFANQVMPYGEFKGQLIHTVPVERLDWYAGQTDEFKIELRRYLQNETIRDELAEKIKDED